MPFKLLAAYDGCSCADDMLDELGRAGLPAEVEVLVVSVGERWLPPPSMYETMGMEEVPHGKAPEEIAEEGAKRLRTLQSGWRVEWEAMTGSPAKQLLARAKSWGADLIAAGSVGHSALERVLVGSVSQKIVNEAHCSVRVSRGFLPGRSGPIQLLLAHDGQPGADRAVAAVAGRNWPKGTEIRVVSCAATKSPVEQSHWAYDVLERAAATLGKAGLVVSKAVLQGDPRRAIVESAKRFGAECIFAGDNDRSVIDRLLLGTVSSAILSRAHCSVEICR